MILPAASLRVAPTVPPAVPRVSSSISCSTPLAEDIWTSSAPVRVEGDTLKTWDLKDASTERVQLAIKSQGRPVDANIELWHTPSYIPTKFRVYTEDGRLRPVDTIIETPKHPKTVAVFNIAQQDFPFEATVAHTGSGKAYESLKGIAPDHIQGANTVYSYTFGPEVDSVAVLLSTASSGERNMKARVEVTSGPNQVKQFVELYASSGYKNPFYAVLATPGDSNVVRVINENTVEFPFDAWVVPLESGPADTAPIISGSA